MSIAEELAHKKVQVVYLRKLLANVNEEIVELEELEQQRDITYVGTYLVPMLGTIKAKFTKCGLTGELRAEVVGSVTD
jgi:hypothetical protein